MVHAGNFAINVIMAYGAGDWVHQIFEYGSGLNEAGIAKFKAGNGASYPTSRRHG